MRQPAIVRVDALVNRKVVPTKTWDQYLHNWHLGFTIGHIDPQNVINARTAHPLNNLIESIIHRARNGRYLWQLHRRWRDRSFIPRTLEKHACDFIQKLILRSEI